MVKYNDLSIWDLVLFRDEPCMVIGLFAEITATTGEVTLWSLPASAGINDVRPEDIEGIRVQDAHRYLRGTIIAYEDEEDAFAEYDSPEDIAPGYSHDGYQIGDIWLDLECRWKTDEMRDNHLPFVHQCQHLNFALGGDRQLALKDLRDKEAEAHMRLLAELYYGSTNPERQN